MIPAPPSSTPAATAPPNPGAPQSTPLAVLVLEDRESDAELMLYELRRGGFAPDAARVATEETFVAALGRSFDVILADYNLPGFDALRALDLLLEHGVDVPVIVVSGSLTDEQALECIGRGASDYLIKDRLARLPFAVQRALLDRQVQRRVAEQRTQLIREQAARARAEAERERMQQVVNAIPEGMLIADAAGRLVMVNEAARRIVGHAAAGGHIRHFDSHVVKRSDGSAYAPDELPLARSVARGEVVQGDQMLLRNTDTDSWTPVLVNSAPLRDATGAITGGVVVFQDISALKDVDRQKNEFLAVVSHDLKNPLTAIRGQAQLLRRRLSRGAVEPEHVGEAVDKIDATAARAGAMIDQLMDITRLQMGLQLPLAPAPTDLVALARRVADEQQRATDVHTIQVEPETPQIHGTWDGTRLERVLENLISNAVKYSPDGGPVRVRLWQVDPDGDEVCLSVEDRGVGIPEADLPRVFERFFRAGNAAGRFAGSGIGLGSAQQIVQAHGGRIDVQSREGEGSTFTIRLPRHATLTAGNTR